MEKADILEMTQQFLQSVLCQPGFKDFMQGCSKIQHSPITSTLPDSSMYNTNSPSPNVASGITNASVASSTNLPSSSSSSSSSQSTAASDCFSPPNIASFQQNMLDNTALISTNFKTAIVTTSNSHVPCNPSIPSNIFPQNAHLPKAFFDPINSKLSYFSNFSSIFTSQFTSICDKSPTFQATELKGPCLDRPQSSHDFHFHTPIKDEPSHLSSFETTAQPCLKVAPIIPTDQHLFSSHSLLQPPTTTLFRPWANGHPKVF